MMRRFLMGAALALAVLAPHQYAAAQEKYPTRPVRMIVSFAAGGPTDIAARIISAKLQELLGEGFVVDNRPGAGGNTGADMAAKAPADGYTLLMATVSTHAINPGLYKKMPYDPVKDFTPIGQVGVTPGVLVVNPSLPVHNVRELIDLVRANPGKYSYGSSGMGSILHLCGELLKSTVGNLDILHVPYRGSGPMINDLLAGQITMAFDGTPTVLPHIRSGGLRAIGGGMATRPRALPDLPTLQEQGVAGFECYTWNAIFAPAGTPPQIVAVLNEAINKALADETVFKRLQETGIDPTPGTTPEKLAAFVRSELAKWAPIIKASGATVE